MRLPTECFFDGVGSGGASRVDPQDRRDWWKPENTYCECGPRCYYLLADVEVIVSYKLAEINTTKLVNLFHRIFAAAQLDLPIENRFRHPVRPREWFLVTLAVIDEAVERIRDGSIMDAVYDPTSARLVER